MTKEELDELIGLSAKFNIGEKQLAADLHNLSTSSGSDLNVIAESMLKRLRQGQSYQQMITGVKVGQLPEELINIAAKLGVKNDQLIDDLSEICQFRKIELAWVAQKVLSYLRIGQSYNQALNKTEIDATISQIVM